MTPYDLYVQAAHDHIEAYRSLHAVTCEKVVRVVEIMLQSCLKTANVELVKPNDPKGSTENLISKLKLSLIGSAATGLAMIDSGIDVSLVIQGYDTPFAAGLANVTAISQFIDRIKCAVDSNFKYCNKILEAGGLELIRCTHFPATSSCPVSNLQFIVRMVRSSCMVPIVITMYNSMAVVSTRYIASCVDFDPAVAKLSRLLKVFTKHTKCSKTDQLGLSSYTLTVLLIYFLQQTELPVLPNLHEEASNTPNIESRYITRDEYPLQFKTMQCIFNLHGYSLGTLWLRLLRFYSREQNWLNIYTGYKSSHSGKVFIANPMLATQNLLTDANVVSRMIAIFQRAYKINLRCARGEVQLADEKTEINPDAAVTLLLENHSMLIGMVNATVPSYTPSQPQYTGQQPVRHAAQLQISIGNSQAIGQQKLISATARSQPSNQHLQPGYTPTSTYYKYEAPNAANGGITVVPGQSVDLAYRRASASYDNEQKVVPAKKKKKEKKSKKSKRHDDWD